MKKYLKIGQISDIHIGEDDSLVQGLNVRKNFLHALNSEAMQDVDFLVLSGDLANVNAEPGAYKFVAEQIKGLKFPVFIIPGNHDKLDVMTQYLNLPNLNGKCYYRYDLEGKTFFFLDSADGTVSKDQLDWFEENMKSVEGEVAVFMHHPPCFGNHRFMDTLYSLKNKEEVQQVFSKYENLKHVFCGHYHNEFQAKFGHVNVHAAPATQMQIDSECPQFKLKSTLPGWQLINWDNETNNVQVMTQYHYKGL